MPVIETKGAASSGGFGQFARQVAANYIEDVFSTWLYTGNGSTQTITNGIDLSTKGGLLWIKGRSATSSSWLVDTARGNTKGLYTSSTLGEQTSTGGSDVSGFSSSGFSLGTNQQALVNTNGGTFASWTFRKQAKFFDVVTYSGDGNSGRSINHSLGSTPGFIIVKNTSTSTDWYCYHQSLGATKYIRLNSTQTVGTWTAAWNDTAPTSSVFYVGNATETNAVGSTYVAYLFANNNGDSGFGVNGTDDVIKVGSFASTGSAQINLGFEPQFVLLRKYDATTNWALIDNVRGWTTDGGLAALYANLNTTESYSPSWGFALTSTGFRETASLGGNWIYVAIRRGPMRTPTSGTSVYSNLAYTGDQTDNRILSQGSSAPNDLFMFMDRTNGAGVFSSSTLGSPVYDRLRGISVSNTSASKTATALGTQFTNAETGVYAFTLADTQTNFSVSANFGRLNTSAVEMVVQMFRRAPGFFDVVCYTGDGTNPRFINHGLGVVPELMMVKRRGPSTQNWLVYSGNLGFAYGLSLNSTAAAVIPAYYWYTTQTATQFNTQLIPNASGETYVAYLFASCPGVSKVGSYTGTGTGTTQQINCGFTGGARFVMIKRTDSTGAWYVWDSARGIVAGNDPYLLLNSTISEVTATDYIDTLSTGFEISNTAPAAINGSGGTFIYLAIA